MSVEIESMFQPLQNRITFKEFVEWKPNGVRYELHDGVIVEMTQPLGGHEEITGFLTLELSAEIKRLKLPYLVPKQGLVKPLESESGYLPDLLILNRPSLASEPFWENESTVSLATSIPLVVEVVSTNWRDDYYKKYGEYEGIEIPEYWIVDYLANGGRKFINNPKLPTTPLLPNWGKTLISRRLKWRDSVVISQNDRRGVTCGDGSVLLELGKEVLNQMPRFVQLLRHTPVGAARLRRGGITAVFP